MNGVNNVNIPLYERQFQLTSSQSSLIVSINDVGAGLTVSSFQNPTSDKRAMPITHLKWRIIETHIRLGL